MPCSRLEVFVPNQGGDFRGGRVPIGCIEQLLLLTGEQDAPRQPARILPSEVEQKRFHGHLFAARHARQLTTGSDHHSPHRLAQNLELADLPIMQRRQGFITNRRRKRAHRQWWHEYKVQLDGEHGSVAFQISSPRRSEQIAAGQYEPPCPECGRPLADRLVPEDAPLDPRSTYAATKLAQEHLATAWARQTGGSVWSLRYHNVYGPRMPRDTPYAGVASIFRSALTRGEAPRVLEDGRQRRDFVHVTDVARANLLALEAVCGSSGTGGLEAVNVCSGQPHTVGELATTLAAVMGGPEPVVVGGARPADVRHVVADPAKARELLGFRAETGFEDGVAAFATDELREPAGVSD